ncbi:kinase-like protein [Paxillus ammoniavirescens]|nr:kinase-like protein [Paxillus ammoniavirescens]
MTDIIARLTAAIWARFRKLSANNGPQEILPHQIKKHRATPQYVGTHGDIWKCTWSQKSRSTIVAVKTIKVPSMETSDIEKVTKVIRREVSVWVTLSHRNILPLYGLTSGFGHLPCLVSPWMENGSLKDYSVKPSLPKDAGLKLAMVYKIADGLKYLHDKGIVHGNLVNTNVLVDDFGEPCITDFGLSIILEEQEDATFNTSFVANVRWSAPELLFSVETVGECQENAPISKPTKAGDLYSFGCIMGYVLFGEEPYASTPSAPAVMRAKINDVAPYPLDSKIGSIYDKFMRRCWMSDQNARPSIDEVLQFVKRSDTTRGTYP